MMAVSSAGLLLATGSVIAYEFVNARQQVVTRLESLAGVVADSSTAAVQFRDEAAAAEALAALRADDQVEAARIDLPDGRALARYRDADALISIDGLAADVRELPGSVIVRRAIVLDGEVIGVLRVRMSLGQLTAHVKQYAVGTRHRRRLGLAGGIRPGVGAPEDDSGPTRRPGGDRT